MRNCPDQTCNFNNGECIDQTSNCNNNDFYGIKCDQECNLIDENCEKCYRDETCISCSDKHYTGPQCQDTCEKCPEGICVIDGKCIDQITKCEGGNYYGEKCENICDTNCEECNREGDCISCPEDKSWGTRCDKLCSNCPEGKCTIEGICNGIGGNCIKNKFTGDKCDILVK